MNFLVSVYEWTLDKPTWLGALLWGLFMGLVIGVPVAVVGLSLFAVGVLRP